MTDGGGKDSWPASGSCQRGQLMVLERMLGAVPHLGRPRQARMARAQVPSSQL